MQANDGSIVGLEEEQYESFLKHNNTNLITVGDVFKVRGCHFRVENISESGISAKGISKREYFDARKIKSNIQSQST